MKSYVQIRLVNIFRMRIRQVNTISTDGIGQTPWSKHQYITEQKHKMSNSFLSFAHSIDQR